MNFNNKKFQENLKYLMSTDKISTYELQRKTNIPAATIQRLYSAKKINPTISTLKPIADFFSLTLNQLIGDDPLPNEKILSKTLNKRDSWMNIPIISWQQAITWKDDIKDLNSFDAISTDINISNKSFALKIYQHNLIGFQNGTIIIVDPLVLPKNNSFVITHKKNSETATLRKYLIYDGDIYFEPLNKMFKSLDQVELTILGTVVQLRLDMISNKNNF